MWFVGNIERLTEKNKNYRKVLHTNPTMQLVVMSLKPREEIGMEIHPGTSQFIRIEEGKARVELCNKGDTSCYTRYMYEGDAVVVPPNTYHNVTNTSYSHDLKLYTIYSPPEHEPGLIEEEKTD